MNARTATLKPRTRARRMHARDFIRVSIIIFLTVVMLVTALAIETPLEGLMAVLAVLCAVVTMSPMLIKKNYCAFEPMTVVTAVVLFSVTAKVWMIFALDNTSAHVQRRLLLGFDTSVLLKGLIATTIGLIVFTLGYLIKLPRFRFKRLFMDGYDHWQNRRLMLLSIVIAAMSVMCFGLFAQSIGFKLGDDISAKRFVQEGTGSGARMFEISYYFYRLAAFSKFGFYLGFVDILYRRRKWFSAQGFLVAITGLQSAMIPLFINNRAGFALIVVDAIVLMYFIRPKLVVPSIAVSSVVVFMAFFVMLTARKGDRQTHVSATAIVEETLGGRDLMDISKTAHIINAVPDPLEYEYGETLWGWMVAPVPSSIWPNKPMWSGRGTYLMHKVYGDMLGFTGLPPGLVAEFYWNLGWYGIVVGMFVFGVVAQTLFRSFYQYRNQPGAILIYTIIINRLILFSFGNDLGTGIVKTILDVAPLMLFIYLLAKRPKHNKKKRRGTSPSTTQLEVAEPPQMQPQTSF